MKDVTKLEESEKEKYGFKVIVLGDPAVGKTSLIRRFADDKFEQSYLPSIGADFTLKIVEFQKVQAILTIWDIGGQREFDGIRSFYYFGANAGILVFDASRPETFQSLLNRWAPQFKEAIGGVVVPSVILCNKVDLVKDKAKMNAQCKEISTKLGFPVFQTSAKTGDNVHAAFEQIALSCFSNNESK